MQLIRPHRPSGLLPGSAELGLLSGLPFHSAWSVLFPYRCLICARPIKSGPVCHRCLPVSPSAALQARCPRCFTPHCYLPSSALCTLCRSLPSAFRVIRYLWDYDHTAKAFIHVMKYRPSQVLCRLAGRLLAAELLNFFQQYDWDSLVPIPSSAPALRTRGFNQCALIAASLRYSLTQLGGPDLKNQYLALTHRGVRAPQASLPHEKRINNARNTFKAIRGRIHAKKILLLDDVLTTGATSTSAALALLDAGAVRVDLIVLARAAAWQEFRHEIGNWTAGCLSNFPESGPFCRPLS